MFKEYIFWGNQHAPPEQQNILGIDLMSVTSYYKYNGTDPNRVRVNATGASTDVYMDQATFDDFVLKLKTCNRLKRSYE